MRSALSLTRSLSSVFWARKGSRAYKNIAVILIGVLGITIAAKMSIPLQPIPITLQDFAVLFIGMTYGWRLGSLTVMLYLFVGAIGLPIFADSPLLAPNAGFLLAFLPATVVSGYLVEHGWGKHMLTTALAALAGLAVIFIGGLSVLAIFVGWQKSIELGLLPFILGDVLKLTFLSIAIPVFWSRNND